MSNKVYFGPGPSQLYPGMDRFFEDALAQDVGSYSHRSQAFKDMYENTVTGLRKLLSLPENWDIVFLGSASEAWERIFVNCVDESSFHFVNGSFSKKFFQYGKALQKNVTKLDAPFLEGFDIADANIPSGTELISVTQNETSTGVSFPLEDIYTLREKHPDALISVDVVSSLPYPNLDWDKVDTAFFSVQKCFGLPSGLGVWLVNHRMLEKAEKRKSEGKSLGAHHTLPELVKKGRQFQTPSTPNTLGIFLLGKVCEELLKKGIDTVRKETDTKTSMLHSYLAESTCFDFAVKNPVHRSQTVVVAETKVSPKAVNAYLEEFNMQVGAGYGDYKQTQIRIANFPAHSIEHIEKLIELLKEVERELTEV